MGPGSVVTVSVSVVHLRYTFSLIMCSCFCGTEKSVNEVLCAWLLEKVLYCLVDSCHSCARTSNLDGFCSHFLGRNTWSRQVGYAMFKVCIKRSVGGPHFSPSPAFLHFLALRV